MQEQRGDLGGPFHYAGDSVGGAVGLQLLLDHPGRVLSAAVLCSGARIGDAQVWTDRIAAVRASGTPGLVASSAERWFAPGFLERSPEVGSACCTRSPTPPTRGTSGSARRWPTSTSATGSARSPHPCSRSAGAHDVAAPVEGLRLVADGVKDGRLVVLDDVAHMAPAEAPEVVAGLLVEHFLGDRALRDGRGGPPQGPGEHERYDAGMAVRREVLGDAHVDRAVEGTTAFTEDFQRFITEYAWGGVWTRPGLDRRSRSMITLTALIARGHDEELAMHVRAARTNGLTRRRDQGGHPAERRSTAACPHANTAFRIAQQVLGGPDA